MTFIKEFLKLTRFEHALMLSFAVLLSEIIVLSSFPAFSLVIILSLLVPIFSEMGSFALNDYLDIETDRSNKRLDRPLVKGTINPKFAFYFSWFVFLISTVLSYFINFYAFSIALVFNILSILYNYKLKDLPLIGNLYIALTMTIPLIFGNLVVSESLHPLIIFLSLFAILSGTSREIIKSVQDMEGDKKIRKSKTYPLIVGERIALLTSGILYAIFVFLTLVLLTMVSNPLTIVILILVMLYFARDSFYLLLNKSNDKFLENSRKFSLMFLFLGMLSLLIESIF